MKLCENIKKIKQAELADIFIVPHNVKHRKTDDI